MEEGGGVGTEGTEGFEGNEQHEGNEDDEGNEDFGRLSVSEPESEDDVDGE